MVACTALHGDEARSPVCANSAAHDCHPSRINRPPPRTPVLSAAADRLLLHAACALLVRTALAGSPWVSVATSADGRVLVAGTAWDDVWISTDAGASFNPTHVFSGGWAFPAASADGTRLFCSSFEHIIASSDTGRSWVVLPYPADKGISVFAAAGDGLTLLLATEDVSRSDGPQLSVYTSADAGGTWTLRTREDQYLAWAGACSSDGQRMYISASPFTQDGSLPLCVLNTSGDAGATWTTASIISGGCWTSLATSAAGSTLAGVRLTSDAADAASVFISLDHGRTFTRRSFTVDVASIAVSADGQRIVAGVWDQQVNAVYTSADSGYTWVSHIPSSSAALWVSATSSADGRALAVVGLNGMFISGDSGATWTIPRIPASPSPRPWSPPDNGGGSNDPMLLTGVGVGFLLVACCAVGIARGLRRLSGHGGAVDSLRQQGWAVGYPNSEYVALMTAVDVSGSDASEGAVPAAQQWQPYAFLPHVEGGRGMMGKHVPTAVVVKEAPPLCVTMPAGSPQLGYCVVPAREGGGGDVTAVNNGTTGVGNRNTGAGGAAGSGNNDCTTGGHRRWVP